jgi:hypothetical protein
VVIHRKRSGAQAGYEIGAGTQGRKGRFIFRWFSHSRHVGAQTAEVDETALYKFVRAFYSYHPDGRLLIFFDDETEFDQYMRIINIIMKANHDDLDEYFVPKFGFTYRAVLSDAENADYDRNEEYVRARRSFREKYPNRLYMELTDIQKEYLLKKSPELKKFFH